MDNSNLDSNDQSSNSTNPITSSKVSEIKLSDPKSSDMGFVDDFKLFLAENSNLVIGVSVGTLILVFGVLFALSSNQSIENQNTLSEIASSATGALIVDEPSSSASDKPPTLVAKTDTNSGTSNTNSSKDSSTSSNKKPITLPPLSINELQDSQNSNNTLNVNDISSGNLSNQALSNQNPNGQSPFAGGSSFLGANTQAANQVGSPAGGIQNLSANIPAASANTANSLGANPNMNRTGGFLSNTQSQVLQSRNVQGNTGPAVYYTLAFSFLASFLYRLRKKKTD
ncbi:hypothetical protein CL656_02985 [bacterium]|nr:hypothetical protein [bacterium]|tara:strand:+ start:19400 stop:20251 length:852 start_codon:yes stop_codon:yes gene_type:complete